jgi:hypothetical protein
VRVTREHTRDLPDQTALGPSNPDLICRQPRLEPLQHKRLESNLHLLLQHTLVIDTVVDTVGLDRAIGGLGQKVSIHMNGSLASLGTSVATNGQDIEGVEHLEDTVNHHEGRLERALREWAPIGVVGVVAVGRLGRILGRTAHLPLMRRCVLELDGLQDVLHCRRRPHGLSLSRR